METAYITTGTLHDDQTVTSGCQSNRSLRFLCAHTMKSSPKFGRDKTRAATFPRPAKKLMLI
jgi:hypothetical protein